MAFEKAKVLKAAEKFLSQGKINAAIKEYRQIVDNDVDDLTTLNMLGDLYVRSGKSDQAITCFERIAEHYSAQEFNLKAIAMYKKIERLKERDPAIAFKLANLYATQGLIVDARAQYLIVADAYSRAGQNKKALDVLHKIADLDPHNTDIRLKLAEGYVKENMRREAASAFLSRSTSVCFLPLANCFCRAKPGHGRLITRAPQAVATSRVVSVDCESTTTISSAQATDSQAARILSASLKVIIAAVIFIGQSKEVSDQ